MIVVDTNIIAGLYFPSSTNKVVEELKRSDEFWVTPVLWRSEFRNVASLYYRRKLVSFSEAVEAVRLAEEDLYGYEISVSSPDVMNVIKESKCSSYDCEFVVLAREMNTFLVTFDKQIIREFPGLAMTPEDYIKKTKKKE